MGKVLEAMEGRVLGTGVEEFRSSVVQEFRSSGVQEFRSLGVQEFNYWKPWRVVSWVRPDKTNTPSDCVQPRTKGPPPQC